MEDKEVGQLWHRWLKTIAILGQSGIVDHSTPNSIRDLIRKLVEERAYKIAVKYFHVHEPDAAEIKRCFKAALRDFGIDPAEWKE